MGILAPRSGYFGERAEALLEQQLVVCRVPGCLFVAFGHEPCHTTQGQKYAEVFGDHLRAANKINEESPC